MYENMSSKQIINPYHRTKRLLFTVTIFVFVCIIGFFVVLDERILHHQSSNLILENNKEKVGFQNQVNIDLDIDLESKIAGVSTEKTEDNNFNQSNQENAETAEIDENVENPVVNQAAIDNNIFLITRVVDGDTIELESGEKVRYIGVNTPETVDPNQPTQCFGPESSKRNKELVEGKKVKLEKDVSDKDKYGRLLRYVYLTDGTFVNLVLVREGYANVATYPPDVKFQNQFLQAEKEASDKNLGLWSKCNNLSQTTSNQCKIKGNISSSGEKIYHLPSQKYYDSTVIDESKGEKWFCSEDEAVKAGWRKSKI